MTDFTDRDERLTMERNYGRHKEIEGKMGASYLRSTLPDLRAHVNKTSIK